MVASIGDVLDVNLYNNISKCTCVDKESDLGLDVGETASSDDRDKNLRHVRKSLQHLNIDESSFTRHLFEERLLPLW